MRSKILLLLWHPRDSIAGGFVRIQELLPYFKDVDVTVIDNKPSILKNKVVQGKIIEYSIPKTILALYRVSFTLGRLFEWAFTMIVLTAHGVRELKKDKYKLIYGPTGENFHIFFSAVILKIVFPRTKLLLDILNFEVPEGGGFLYFRSNLKNGVGLFRALVVSLEISIGLFIERKLIRVCDSIITVGPRLREIVARYYPLDKIGFTPSGIRISPRKNPNPGRNIAITEGIFIGRHTLEKGVFDLIKVWHKVCAVRPDARLTMIGFSDLTIKHKLTQKIVKKNLQRNIILRGVLSEQEKWERLKRAKIFLHLAYFEPTMPTITILEALSFGIPVVTYDVEAFDDYPQLRHNPSIFTIENKNIEKATNAILSILSMSSKEQYRISRIARELAKIFSWENIAKIEIKAIKRLIDS